ncbi:MAG: LysM peptidoglycan-binding domain-containing protein [Clostridiales bacterium]|nr:LysM peptidoglycan-binding domain-containing protein [Clostridiales bacterium]
MDENMNNNDFENESEGLNPEEETAFGSSEYYKKLYDDFPEDVAEMLIGTHPLMKKEVSEELTHSIKIKSAREKNLRAVNERAQEEAYAEDEEAETSSASRDPIDDDEELESYVDDLTSFTKGLVSSSPKNKHREEAEEAEEVYAGDKSDDDITAEKVAQMLGGVNVEAVDEEEFDDFEEEIEEAPKKKAKKAPKREDRSERSERPRRKRRTIEEKDLELSNIDKQADLNELFREDDDYYEEKHSGNSVLRIVIIIVLIVVLAFFIYRLASLSGQVTKLTQQNETYVEMEAEYEELKLENLSLTEQVEELQNQLNGGSTTENEDADTTGTSGDSTTTTASTTSGSTTYTVQEGDTYWGIATKMYGNGSYYTRILTANGLSENDSLRVGMTLTIPAA